MTKLSRPPEAGRVEQRLLNRELSLIEFLDTFWKKG